MCHSTLFSDWQKDKYQEYGSILLGQTAGRLWKCVSVHAPVRLPFARCLCFADCVLRWASPCTLKWISSNLISPCQMAAWHAVLLRNIRLWGEAADCAWCVESPRYYEPLVTARLRGCCRSRRVMQTMLVTYTIHRKLPRRPTFIIAFFHSPISICLVHYGNIILSRRQICTVETFLITSTAS